MLFLASSIILALVPAPTHSVPVLDSELQVIGSAVLLDDRLVLTAAHVVVDAGGAATVDCGGVFMPAEILKLDVAGDLAIMRLPQRCGGAVSPLAAANPDPGTDVYVIGCPARHCGRVTKGIVTAYDRSSTGAEMHTVLVTDAPIWFGNSGGGMWNDRGELVGICSQIAPEIMTTSDGSSFGQNYGLFIPVESIARFLVGVTL